MSAIRFVFRVLFRGVFGGSLKLVAALAALVLGLIVLMAGAEVLWLAPWAYSVGGRPVLVGSWVGRFRAPSGASGAVYLDLHHSVGDGIGGRRTMGGSGNPKLHGDARWCFAGGSRRVFVLSGIANANASRIVVHPDSDLAQVEGLHFGTLIGSWTGERLQLAGTARTFHSGKWLFSPHTADGKTATEFAMQRGDTSAFESACGQLR
jgi:hypothetical protein